MPDGKTHFTWWMAGLPVVVGASAVLAIPNPVLGVGNVMGYLMGAFMDGDLDQIGLSSSEGRMMRTFKIIGVAWVMYWMPYAYILPHRSFWSHFPFISTAIRLAYLSIPAIFIIWITGFLNYTNIKWLYDRSALFVLFGVWNGLSWADAIHYTLDVLHKERRK